MRGPAPHAKPLATRQHTRPLLGSAAPQTPARVACVPTLGASACPAPAGEPHPGGAQGQEQATHPVQDWARPVLHRLVHGKSRRGCAWLSWPTQPRTCAAIARVAAIKLIMGPGPCGTAQAVHPRAWAESSARQGTGAQSAAVGNRLLCPGSAVPVPAFGGPIILSYHVRCSPTASPSRAGGRHRQQQLLGHVLRREPEHLPHPEGHAHRAGGRRG